MESYNVKATDGYSYVTVFNLNGCKLLRQTVILYVYIVCKYAELLTAVGCSAVSLLSVLSDLSIICCCGISCYAQPTKPNISKVTARNSSDTE